MSPVLPFDIVALIIDIVGENEDTDLLKELALVSHSSLQICTKHLFATVELHDTSSKKGFLKLLASRPDFVKHIRKLTYKVRYITFNHYESHPPIQAYNWRFSGLIHPSEFPPNYFSSQLPRNQWFRVYLE
jgi:hypothetical protein